MDSREEAPALAVLTALAQTQKVVTNGRTGWRNTSCPNTAAHASGDRNPSFGWKRAPDGNILVKCFGGCTVEDITTSLGLTTRDLFVPANGVVYTNQRVYIYSDPAGKQHLKTRLDYRRADGTPGKDVAWEAGAPANGVLWYRHEVLTDPAKDGFVYVTEGEADADALAEVLRDTDRAVIAAPSASYEPPDEAIAALRDRTVILWPDEDLDPTKGHALMERLWHRLADTADLILWIDPPNRASLPDGAGAADWVASLPTAGEEQAGAVRALDRMTTVEDPGPRPPRGRIGQRTVADLPYGDPPPQIVPPFLDPEEPTLVYGPGGTGKGFLTAWLALLARRAGHVPMILDYESHEREWGTRIRGLGATDAEMAGIPYRSPWQFDWEEKRGVLHAVADLVRTDCDRLGVTLLIIDSYLPAAGTAEAMGGQAGAIEYFSALARIGRPSLTIAHVTGGGQQFPDKPYGSVYVHNLARETWAVEQLVLPDEPADPHLISLMPTVLALELRNKKRAVAMRTRPQFVTFSFYPDGHIEVEHSDTALTASKRAAGDLAVEVLTGAPKPLTYKQIADAIKDATGEVVTESALRTAFSRGKVKAEIEKAGKTPQGKELWRLKP